VADISKNTTHIMYDVNLTGNNNSNNNNNTKIYNAHVVKR